MMKTQYTEFHMISLSGHRYVISRFSWSGLPPVYLLFVQERRKTHDTSFQNTSMNELEEWEAACDTKEKNLLSALDTLKRTLKEVSFLKNPISPGGLSKGPSPPLVKIQTDQKIGPD